MVPAPHACTLLMPMTMSPAPSVAAAGVVAAPPAAPSEIGITLAPRARKDRDEADRSLPLGEHGDESALRVGDKGVVKLPAAAE